MFHKAVQRVPVTVHHIHEEWFRFFIKSAMLLIFPDQLCIQHGCQRKGYERGNKYRTRDHNPKFLEEPSHKTFHEDHREEYCCKRYGSGNYCKEDLLGAFKSSL